MMTNKKKIAAVLAGAALALSVPAAAFAGSETLNSETGTTNIPVTGTYTGGGGGTSYKVEISWGDMKYNYSTAATQWDTEQHKYVSTGNGGGFTPSVSGTSDLITVKNYSNIAITAQLSFTGAAADTTNNILEDITGGFGEQSGTVTDGNNQLVLKSAAIKSDGSAIDPTDTTTVGTASTDTTYLVITGGALAEGATDVPLGTVTVTISSGNAASE